MAKRNVEMNLYIQRFDGEWVDVTCERFLACCDCGLVHREQYRIITSDEGEEHILRRAIRDKSATAYRRQTIEIKASIKTLKEK